MLLPFEQRGRLVGQFGNALTGFKPDNIRPYVLFDHLARVLGRFVLKNDDGCDRLTVARKLQLHPIKAFVRMKDAIKLLDSTGKVSYCLIIAEPGVDIKALQQRIRDRIADIEVYTREEFSENSRGIVVSMMGRPLYVMIAISFLVGVAIVALTIFSITTEQLRDFGVIKAIGGTNGQVYRVVMRQALMLGVAGYILGAIIAYGVQFIIRERLGDVNVQISPTLLAFAFLLTLGMSIFASIVSVRRIANVDPAIVFRT